MSCLVPLTEMLLSCDLHELRMSLAFDFITQKSAFLVTSFKPKPPSLDYSEKFTVVKKLK